MVEVDVKNSELMEKTLRRLELLTGLPVDTAFAGRHFGDKIEIALNENPVHRASTANVRINDSGLGFTRMIGGGKENKIFFAISASDSGAEEVLKGLAIAEIKGAIKGINSAAETIENPVAQLKFKEKILSEIAKGIGVEQEKTLNKAFRR